MNAISEITRTKKRKYCIPVGPGENKARPPLIEHNDRCRPSPFDIHIDAREALSRVNKKVFYFPTTFPTNETGMDLSATTSSRILTASSFANTPAGAIIIPAVKSSSTLSKSALNPIRIGDAAFQKMRSITTTPPVQVGASDSSDQQPAVFIMNSNSIKSEPQQQRTITVNRLLFSNNNNPTSTTIINGQNAINLATLVSSLNTLNQMALLQSNNTTTAPTMTTTQNSIAKLLETPILSNANVVQQPQATLIPAMTHNGKVLCVYRQYRTDRFSFQFPH